MLRINKLPLAEEDLINIWIYGCLNNLVVGFVKLGKLGKLSQSQTV